MKIRTVTVGIPDAFSREQLQFAVDFNCRCRGRFEANGYEVQTTRVNSQEAPTVINSGSSLQVIVKPSSGSGVAIILSVYPIVVSVLPPSIHSFLIVYLNRIICKCKFVNRSRTDLGYFRHSA